MRMGKSEEEGGGRRRNRIEEENKEEEGGRGGVRVGWGCWMCSDVQSDHNVFSR